MPQAGMCCSSAVVTSTVVTLHTEQHACRTRHNVEFLEITMWQHVTVQTCLGLGVPLVWVNAILSQSADHVGHNNSVRLSARHRSLLKPKSIGWGTLLKVHIFRNSQSKHIFRKSVTQVRMLLVGIHWHVAGHPQTHTHHNPPTPTHICIHPTHTHLHTPTPPQPIHTPTRYTQ